MESNAGIRVAICDDHRILREGVKQIINQKSDNLKVVIDVADGESLLSQLANIHVDVVVLDISLPGQNGIDILAQLQQDHSSLQILMLSMYPEHELAPRALKAGASGYLHKDSAPEHLINAILTVYDGEKYVSDGVMEQYRAFPLNHKEKPLHNQLSKRENEVLMALGRGSTIQEISQALSLSDKTVSTYKTRLFKKMGFVNMIDLVTYMQNHQLLDDITPRQ